MAGTKNDLESILSGLTPIERLNPSGNESQWYYIDPRSVKDDFSMLSDFKTIDVPNKNTPNPALQEIMEEDAEQNPEQYYVWHTMGDDKVRSEHAAREGMIFSWNNAPEGGHPGEAHNCRCSAEPYMEYANSWINRRKRLYKAVENHLKREEGNEKQIYLDTRGKKTIGIGINIDKKEDFDKVNWKVGNRPATQAEKDAAFDTFEKLKKQGYFGAKLTAKAYQSMCNLHVDQKEIDRLLKEHLDKDLTDLEKSIHEFKNYPQALQEVLLDLKYNTGNASKANWPRLYEGIAARDVKYMSEQVHRRGISESRNDWARKRILSLATSDWALGFSNDVK